MSARLPFPLPFPGVLGGPDSRTATACPRPAPPAAAAQAAAGEDHARSVGELVAIWNGSVLSVRHFDRGRGERSFRLGENPACDLWMPLEQLGGRDAVRLARTVGQRLVVTLLPGAAAAIGGPDGTSVDRAELIRSSRATPSTEIEGGHDVTLEAGERLHQDVGEFTFLANMVPRSTLALPRRIERTTPLFVAASLAVHVAFLAIAWHYQSDRQGLAVDLQSIDRSYAQLLSIAPPQLLVAEEITFEEQEEAQDQAQDQKVEDDFVEVRSPEEGGGTGARAAGDSGQAGDRNAPDVDKMIGVKGPRDNPTPHMARTTLLEDIKSIGALSALSALQSKAPTSMFSPYSTALGNDPVDTRGHLMGSSYGDAYGVGGFDMFGTGVGGNGTNLVGFGLSDVGGMGHGYGDRDGVGIGREGGIMGRGHGESCNEDGCRGMPDLRGHQGTGPELRLLEGRTFGGLSKEVVQRHVRANRGRIRHCYESALQTQANLSGRVTVSFVIAPPGNVQSVQTQANTTNDTALAQCIESVVGRINFPSADGVTACTYPFLLQMAGAADEE
jgi:hypothetical protein